jgi:GST-like protein
VVIHLYTWNTPNGIKPLIMLEEVGIDYSAHPINISTGDQISTAFLSVNPNGRIPVLIDDELAGSASMGEVRGQGVFESGSILIYLANKFSRFLPTDPAAKADVMSWVCWGAEKLGPAVRELHWLEDELLGNGVSTEEGIDLTIEHLEFLDHQLNGLDFLTGDYSIADMMCWPWAKAGIKSVGGRRAALDAWTARVGERPAVQRAQSIALKLGANAI